MRRNVLITGGSNGLGKALAQHYLQAEDIVTVLDIEAPKFSGANYIFYDCLCPDTHFIEDSAPFDLVICNAGISDSMDFSLASEETDLTLMQINTFSHIKLIRDLIRNKKIKQSGRIGLICSASVFLPFSIAISYSASKAALDGFGHALAPYLLSQKISVSCVYPGPLKTEHAEKYYSQYNEGKGSDPVKIAKKVITGIQKRKKRIYPDLASRVFKIGSFIIPRTLDRLIAQKYHNQKRKF